MTEVAEAREDDAAVPTSAPMQRGLNGARAWMCGPSATSVTTMTAPTMAAMDVVTITRDHARPPRKFTRCGAAAPNVSAPTRLPTANPRSRTNQLAASFIAGGYVPAIASPVTKRQASTSGSVSIQTSRPAFATAPISAAKANSRRAPSASASVKSVLAAVPTTNPSVTAIESHAFAAGDIQRTDSIGTIAVAENQSESAPSSARQIQTSIRHRRSSSW